MGFNNTEIRFINENIGSMPQQDIASQLGVPYWRFIDRLQSLQLKGLVPYTYKKAGREQVVEQRKARWRRIPFESQEFAEIEVDIILGERVKVKWKGETSKTGAVGTMESVGRFIKEYPTYCLFESDAGRKECFLKADISNKEVEVLQLKGDLR